MWKQRNMGACANMHEKYTSYSKIFGEIAEINMVVKVPAACKGALYKGLKEYLTAAQQCYTTEERVYAAEQCDSG